MTQNVLLFEKSLQQKELFHTIIEIDFSYSKMTEVFLVLFMGDWQQLTKFETFLETGNLLHAMNKGCVPVNLRCLLIACFREFS